jgi:Domain of unknown function (DUF4375)
MSGTMHEGRLQTVIVPRKWADAAKEPGGAHHLAAAVVDYVNDIQHAGVFATHELPPKAMQAYHADYYEAQVKNGGHSQFIFNARGQLPAATADALAAFAAMGATVQHQILAEMATWVKSNPEEAAVQDGFGTRAQLLDGLDTRFHAADEQLPVAAFAARWIGGWPELRIVEDDKYAAAIEELAASNPARGPRLIWRNIENIRQQLTDPLQIAIAASCGAAGPAPEIKTGVGGGFYQEIEGEQCLAFFLRTLTGERICVPGEDGARLYEYIQQGPIPESGPDLDIADLGDFKPPVVGARLATVSAETIQRLMAQANETKAPEAIDLLLRKAGLEPAAMITASLANDGGAIWIVATEQNLSLARSSSSGAQLRDHEGKPLATVTRAEIEQHASEAEAAGLTMRPPA